MDLETRRFARSQLVTELLPIVLVAGLALISTQSAFRPRRLDLTITPLGTHNAQARSCEVWVSRVGGIVTHIHAGAGWTQRGWDWVWPCSEGSPSSLQLSLENPQHPTVLLKTPWSGKARVQVGSGPPVEVDLGAPHGEYELGGAEDQRWTVSSLLRWIVLGLGTAGALRVLASGWTKWRDCTRAGLVAFSAGLLALLLVFPGQMSPDSRHQWQQALGGIEDAVHPPVHTLLIRALQAVWFHPAVLVVAQAAIAGLIIRAVHDTLSALGIPLRVRRAQLWLFCLWPTVVLIQSTLWKDVLFSWGVLLTSVHLVRALHGLETRRGYVALALGLLTTRHNGPMVVLAYLAALYAVTPKQARRPAAVVGGLLMLLFSMSLAPLYEALGLENRGSVAISVTHALAKYASVNEIPAQDWPTLRAVASPEVWASSYEPRNADPLWFNPAFANRKADEMKGALASVLLRLIRARPAVFWSHMVDRTSVIWRWLPAPGEKEGQVPYEIFPNALGLTFAPLSPGLLQLYREVVSGSAVGRALFWRPALPLLVLLIVVAVLVMRARAWRWALILAPALGNTLPYVVLIPAPDVRYFYSTFLLALVLWPLALPRERLA